MFGSPGENPKINPPVVKDLRTGAIRKLKLENIELKTVNRIIDNEKRKLRKTIGSIHDHDLSRADMIEILDRVLKRCNDEIQE